MSYEAAGISRIRFDRPAFKVPDLGMTNSGRRVGEVILETLPITILLNALSLPITYLVAIAAGVYAARRRGGWFDLTSGVAFLALWSIPVIWAGTLAISYFASSQYPRLHWFPTSGLHAMQADAMPFLPRLNPFADGGFQRGWLLDATWHLLLPVLCLTYGSFAVMSKVMRGATLDNLSADYVRTARAKGLPDARVLWQHVFRNSLLPLIHVRLVDHPRAAGRVGRRRADFQHPRHGEPRGRGGLPKRPGAADGGHADRGVDRADERARAGFVLRRRRPAGEL